MKIGLRTIKTATAAVLAMSLAKQLQLLYAPSAGIIAILSVGNTKKTSLKTGLGRLISLAIATVISFLCFTFIGYNSIAFGIYLLFFIPIAVHFKLTDGIVVNSVLVTHYLLEKSFALELIFNEFLLMILGVGLALLSNLYMPNTEKIVVKDREIIEDTFRSILFQMASELNRPMNHSLKKKCEELLQYLRESQKKVIRHQENQWIQSDLYYEEYFLMRRSQARILLDMAELLNEIHVEEEYVDELRQILNFTAQTLAEKNDGQLILDKINALYDYYREKELPRTREEFEQRARLFQFLQSFTDFIEIKSEFAKSLSS